MVNLVSSRKEGLASGLELVFNASTFLLLLSLLFWSFFFFGHKISSFTYLCLSFLIYKMGITVPIWVCCEQ